MLHPSAIPLHYQLKELFVEKINSGEWPVGALIPTEAALCAVYAVSRGPVRQAIDQLVREGLLCRKQGKGTWVLPPKIERSLGRFYSFTDLIVQQGVLPAAQILSFERVAAARSVARTLALSEGAPVYKIVRLRLAGTEPLVLESVFVPAVLCPRLTVADVENSPLYTLLEKQQGLPLVRARQYFEAVSADPFEAHLLHITVGAPVLLLQNITYQAGDHPVVLSKALLRGDRLRYYVDLPAEISKIAVPSNSPVTEW